MRSSACSSKAELRAFCRDASPLSRRLPVTKQKLREPPSVVERQAFTVGRSRHGEQQVSRGQRTPECMSSRRVIQARCYPRLTRSRRPIRRVGPKTCSAAPWTTQCMTRVFSSSYAHPHGAVASAEIHHPSASSSASSEVCSSAPCTTQGTTSAFSSSYTHPHGVAICAFSEPTAGSRQHPG
jgi:hypothetical protein